MVEIIPAECQALSLAEFHALPGAILRDFIGQEKKDGMRIIIQPRAGPSGQNVMTGRTFEANGSLRQYQDRHPHIRDARLPFDVPVDGELMKDGTVFVFDVPCAPGSQMARLEALAALQPRFPAWLRLLPSTAYFSQLLNATAAGSIEGFVLKHRDCRYGHGWHKMKHTMTHDATVHGLDRDTGVAEVRQGKVPCGKVSCVPASVRRGDVIEFVAFGKTEAGKFKSASYVRSRPDKTCQQPSQSTRGNSTPR
jgi:hypothetical protein